MTPPPPSSTFLPWAHFHAIEFPASLVTIVPISADVGCGLVATKTVDFTSSSTDSSPAATGGTVLVRVPKDLVLSAGLVEEHGKVDRELREVLEGVEGRREGGDGDGGLEKTPRGAILLFLLVQLTHLSTSTDPTTPTIGVSHPLTHYINSLLSTPVPLPTFYTDTEREILFGTSLEDALDQKMRALEREFEVLRARTLAIPWCAKVWWNYDDDDNDGQEQGQGHSKLMERRGLQFSDYLRMDALYRSRALDLPGTGHAMVPCIDMANHASRGRTKALYETDGDGNAVLVLADGVGRIEEGEEITISYGDDKGASEMVYSYGFIEDEMQGARQLFLDLEMQEDDPLARVKRVVCGEAPGVRLFEKEEEVSSRQRDGEELKDEPGRRVEEGGRRRGGGKIDWESAFIFWAVVNQEDGLDFTRIFPPSTTSASSDTTPPEDPTIQCLWHNDPFPPSDLVPLLRQSPRYDIFLLRALTLLHHRIQQQLSKLRISEEPFNELVDQTDTLVRIGVYRTIEKLRRLEQGLLERADEEIEGRIQGLMEESEVVREYLAENRGDGNEGGSQEGSEREELEPEPEFEEDFS